MTTARAGAVQEPRVFYAFDKDGKRVLFSCVNGRVCFKERDKISGKLIWWILNPDITWPSLSSSELRAIANCLGVSTGAGLGEGKEAGNGD